MKISAPRSTSGMRTAISVLAAIGLVAGAAVIAPSLTAGHSGLRLRQVDSQGPAVPLSSQAPAPLTAASGGASSAAYVALGDSYSSGMGTYSYRSADPNPDCHRSDLTYSVDYASTYRLPSWLGQVQPVLLACSGATTSALTGPYTTPDSTIEPAQLYTGALGASTKLVTVTIGGDDVGFADILAKCIPGGDSCWLPTLNDPASRDYDPTVTGAYQRATDVGAILNHDYTLIQQQAPNAHVIVIAYPEIFPPAVEDCGSSLGIGRQMSQDSLQAIRDTWEHLNSVIKTEAADTGVAYLDDSDQWVGHDFCSGGAAYANGLNGISATSLNADPESYHPDTTGYFQLASDLNTFITTYWP